MTGYMNYKEISEENAGDFSLFRAHFPSYYTHYFILSGSYHIEDSK